ncbi:MAG: DDE-type integrase/transposase/recombinase [Nostoc sp.]
MAALKADHNINPRVINVDKDAAYPPSINQLKKSELLPDDCELRRVKYLNNYVEQDHRFIKGLVKPGMGFASFNTARPTLRGYEAMNMIRKGQVKGVEKTDIAAQVKFVVTSKPGMPTLNEK